MDKNVCPLSMIGKDCYHICHPGCSLLDEKANICLLREYLLLKIEEHNSNSDLNK